MKDIITKIFARKKKSENLDFSSIKSVLIRPIGTGLGDAVVLTAVLKQLKEAYPNIKTGVLAVKRNEIVFKNNPLADKIIKDSFIGYLSNRGKWQVFIDYTPSFTTKNIIRDFFLKPAYTICFEKRDKKHYNHNTVRNYDYYVPDLAQTHLSKSLQLTPFKPYINAEKPIYILPELSKEEEKVKTYFRGDKINIILAPHGSDRAVAPHELQSILKSAFKGKEDKINLIIPFTQKSKEYLNILKDIQGLVTSPLSVEEFFALIKNADMIIATDSAAVHLACAYQKPLAAFYSGWDRGFVLFSPLENGEVKVLRPKAKTDSPAKEIKDIPLEEAAKSIQSLLPK